MAIINPEVPYAGKELPLDRAPLAIFMPDPAVPYAGKELPRDAVPVLTIPVDPTNNPSVVIIGSVQLPNNTAIYVSAKKKLAMSQILDGVVVYERILREPYEIEFEGSIITQTGNQYVFGQTEIDTIWSNVWLPNTVQSLTNTYLNKLGIMEIVIDSITPVTVRGSTNIPFRIKCYENVPGQSLIIG